MTYASRDDIVEIWGAEFFTDILPEDANELAAVAGALRLASDEVDLHLSARFTLPLANQPAVLIGPTVDIAVYKLANRHSALTKTIEDRYENACDLMKRIADGKAGLGADEPSVSNEPNTSKSGAAFSAEPRIFTRGLL